MRHEIGGSPSPPRTFWFLMAWKTTPASGERERARGQRVWVTKASAATPGDGLTARHAKRYGREDLLRPHHVRHLSASKRFHWPHPTRKREQPSVRKTFVERRYDCRKQASPWGSPRAHSPPWPTAAPTDKKGRLGAEGKGEGADPPRSRSSRRPAVEVKCPPPPEMLWGELNVFYRKCRTRIFPSLPK